MQPISGRLEREPLARVVRAIHQARRTGVLEVQFRGQRRRLHFRAGELCLPGGHPLARRLDALTRDDSPGGSAAMARELSHLLARMVDVVSEWTEGEFQFVEDPQVGPAELVGPLPTIDFIMDCAAAQETGDGDPFAAVGGDRSLWVAESDPELLRSASRLSPVELWILERLQAPTAFRELAAIGPVPRREIGLSAQRLAAAGFIRSSDGRVECSGPEAEAPGIVDAAVLARFEERIRSGLSARPLTLSPVEHQALLAEVLAQFAGLNHYELLRVAPSASIDEVHAAFERLAREAHPDHAAHLGLESARNGLRLLFERATAAYLTLADPERRKAYDAAIGQDVILVRTAAPVAKRAEEQREIAKGHFDQALAFAAKGELHFAIGLLEQAVKADPSRSQYFLELGRLQARNPNWLRHAAESFRRAIELAPRDLATRLHLASLYEQVGDPVRARVQYHTILRMAPENPEAAAAIERLEGAASGVSERGILGRLFRR